MPLATKLRYYKLSWKCQTKQKLCFSHKNVLFYLFFFKDWQSPVWVLCSLKLLAYHIRSTRYHIVANKWSCQNSLWLLPAFLTGLQHFPFYQNAPAQVVSLQLQANLSIARIWYLYQPNNVYLEINRDSHTLLILLYLPTFLVNILFMFLIFRPHFFRNAGSERHTRCESI